MKPGIRLLLCSAVGAAAITPLLSPASELSANLFARIHELQKLERAHEVVADQESEAAERLALVRRFDADKNGELNDREFAAWETALRKHMAGNTGFVRRFDADRDGRLNDKEWQAARRHVIPAHWL